MKKTWISLLSVILLCIFGSAPMWSQAPAAQGSQSAKPAPPKMTPEQIEALKQQREKALAENALITEASAALNVKEWQKAADVLKQLIVMEPGRWDFLQSLGAAQLNLGQNNDAIQSLESGIKLAQGELSSGKSQTEPAKLKAALGQMLANEGNANIKLRNNEKAIALFTQAAELDPNPGMAYFNLCATQYNMGNMDGAVIACDKAIAANPNKADAWFIKGSAMYGNGKLDAAGKYVLPKGAVEALKKYLALTPAGSHVEDVKAMLDAVGEKY